MSPIHKGKSPRPGPSNHKPAKAAKIKKNVENVVPVKKTFVNPASGSINQDKDDKDESEVNEDDSTDTGTSPSRPSYKGKATKGQKVKSSKRTLP